MTMRTTLRLKNKYPHVLGLAAMLSLVGCSGSSSSSSLDPRFRSDDSVRFVQDGVTEMSVLSNDLHSMASGLSISLALTINPPLASQTGGVQVYASDLKVVGTKVLTGYNVPGDVQRGWMDYIDVTTLAVPLLLDSKYFADTDVNSVAMTATGKFAFTGAKEGIGASVRVGTYGLLGITPGLESTFSPYAGTGITFDSTGNTLGVTMGSNGGAKFLNATTLADTYAGTSIVDARGISQQAGTNKYFVVRGAGTGTGTVTNADVKSFSSAGVLGTAATLTGGTVAESKATVQAGGTYVLATTGDGGFNVLCAADMGVMATQAQYTYTNYASLGLPAPALTVTNAAVFGPGMIFTAAGQAGVRVYNFVKRTGTTGACNNVTVSYMGTFEFNNSISVNNLVYANVLTTPITYTGTLYIAAGGGGFKAVTVVATRNALSDLIEY